MITCHHNQVTLRINYDGITVTQGDHAACDCCAKLILQIMMMTDATSLHGRCVACIELPRKASWAALCFYHRIVAGNICKAKACCALIRYTLESLCMMDIARYVLRLIAWTCWDMMHREK